ncbi:hypothetical protein RFI_27245 [Reticulomyxa filosa]|uniref:Uncharacterized protein n=1 Tax=Reticulomyxa filosa TaxID=46433 RepID=X6M824_RETFI|nr:hypothetical protein RFI_27245 [Reticulomyxa filosa]|eukprot:ETO10133.1 hypothetical protein RFI_27245 [Reticulomyxa filosa]
MDPFQSYLENPMFIDGQTLDGSLQHLQHLSRITQLQLRFHQSMVEQLVRQLEHYATLQEELQTQFLHPSYYGTNTQQEQYPFREEKYEETRGTETNEIMSTGRSHQTESTINNRLKTFAYLEQPNDRQTNHPLQQNTAAPLDVEKDKINSSANEKQET